MVKKLLYQTPDPKFAIVGVEKKPEPTEGILDLGSMDIYVDPP